MNKKVLKGLLAVWLCVLFPGAGLTAVTMTRAQPKKVDIVLLQDESGSMDDTDPHQIRKHVATFLIEDLEVAGEGNRMALVIYGARSEVRVPLSRDFDRVQQESENGFYQVSGPFNRQTLSSLPPRQYTDIYGALQAAFNMLKQEPEVNARSDRRGKEVHVILLTDGKMYPWPGNDRYGPLAVTYQECLSRGTGFKKCDERFRERAIETDRTAMFDPAGLLASFKERGWRVHCLGFSSGADEKLLSRISHATYGHSGIAKDYTQLLQTLENIIPPAPNVVEVLLKEFCKTRRVEEQIEIGREIRALQFKIDLNRMLAQKASIKRQNLKIEITDPQGNSISSDQGTFRFNTSKEGFVVTASYFQKKPAPGTWRILVEGLGADICGNVKAKLQVPFEPELTFVPEMSTYFGGQKFNVHVTLKNVEDHDRVPMKEVLGEFQFAAKDGTFTKKKVDFRVSPGGDAAEAVFAVPEEIKGRATIETVIIDRKYSSRTTAYRDFTVEPGPETADLSADPPKLMLGMIGDETSEVVSDPIKITTQSYKELEVDCVKPKLTCGGQQIPIVWVSLEPSSGVISVQRPLDIRVKVSLPEGVSLALPQGVYNGEIKVEPRKMSGECVIPVELQVEVPEIFVEPQRLRYDFWWRIGRPVTGSIRVGHTSGRDRILRVELPRYFKDARRRYEKDIRLSVPGTETLEWDLAPGTETGIPLSLSLENTSLNRRQRIPRGTYTAVLRVTGEGLAPREVPVRVRVPEKPAVVRYGRPFAKYAAAVFAFMALFGCMVFLYRARKSLFRKKYKMTFDKGTGKLPDRAVRKFGIDLVKKTSRDADGFEWVSYAMPASVTNQALKIEDPDTGEEASFPANGVDDVENWKGMGLSVVKTEAYTFRLIPGQRSFVIRVLESPYGGRGGYFFRKVVIYLIPALVCAGLAFWFCQIV